MSDTATLSAQCALQEEVSMQLKFPRRRIYVVRRLISAALLVP